MLEKVLKNMDLAFEIPINLRMEKLNLCLKELRQIPKEFQDDSFFYLQGYIFYSLRPQRLNEAEISFRKALELNPSNTYAQLYLGHSLYDKKEYEEAKKEFISLEKANLPDYLQMKVNEMIVCCEIRQNGLSEPNLQSVRNLIAEYAVQNYLEDYLFELSKVLREFGTDIEDEEKIALASIGGK